MDLCSRHSEALTFALELRGLLRPSLMPEPAAFDPYAFARQAIVEHATNFAGRAALEMLTGTGPPRCPLCFVNTQNPSRLNLDRWVDNAADEALAASARPRDGTMERKLRVGS